MKSGVIEAEFDFQVHERSFLSNLDSKDNSDLYENILARSFSGDNFENNIKAIFSNYYLQEGINGNDFYNSFLLWIEKKLDDAFKIRKTIAAKNTIGLCGAFGLSLINPVAGIATGIAVSATAGVAEGVAKRNIANLGHLQGHLSHKVHSCTIKMIERAMKLDCFTPQARTKLQDLENPKSTSKKSALARFASYVSGPVVSGANNLVSRFSGISTVISGTIGAFVPFLPLLTVKLSKMAANLRHKSAVNEGKFLNNAADIIFDERSWTDKKQASAAIKELMQEFSQNLAM